MRSARHYLIRTTDRVPVEQTATIARSLRSGRSSSPGAWATEPIGLRPMPARLGDGVSLRRGYGGDGIESNFETPGLDRSSCFRATRAAPGALHRLTGAAFSAGALHCGWRPQRWTGTPRRGGRRRKCAWPAPRRSRSPRFPRAVRISLGAPASVAELETALHGWRESRAHSESVV